MCMGNSIPEAKQHLRREMRRLRDSLSCEERSERSRRILERLRGLPCYHEARMVLFYASFGSEVDTWEGMDRALQYGKRVALPQVKEDSGCLLAIEVKDLKGTLKIGYRGIPEPKGGEDTGLRGEDIGLILVPGLAFDHRGYRLGYGRGFYDRFLSGLSVRPPALGLAFDFQLIEELPISSTDFPLDGILTENRMVGGKGMGSPS